MKLKSIIASVLASSMLSVPAFAETNNELMYLDAVINYASNLYIAIQNL